MLLVRIVARGACSVSTQDSRLEDGARRGGRGGPRKGKEKEEGEEGEEAEALLLPPPPPLSSPFSPSSSLVLIAPGEDWLARRRTLVAPFASADSGGRRREAQRSTQGPLGELGAQPPTLLRLPPERPAIPPRPPHVSTLASRPPLPPPPAALAPHVQLRGPGRGGRGLRDVGGTRTRPSVDDQARTPRHVRGPGASGSLLMAYGTGGDADATRTESPKAIAKPAPRSSSPSGPC